MLFHTLAQTTKNIVVSRPPDVPESSGDDILSGIIRLVFISLAGISGIVLVLQGINYSLSSGDTEKVNKARRGIIYALIGIAVSVTAWSLLDFAIDNVIGDISSTTASESSLNSVFAGVISFIMLIGAIISVNIAVVGGIKFITATGNPEENKKARNTIIYALIGVLVIALSNSVLSFIISRL